jgi:hypothetical protein
MLVSSIYRALKDFPGDRFSKIGLCNVVIYFVRQTFQYTYRTIQRFVYFISLYNVLMHFIGQCGVLVC